MADGESLYPLEIVVAGTPVSLQGSAKSKERWRRTVREAARERVEATADFVMLDQRPLALTIWHFPALPMQGDIDNIIKPIMDALIGISYLDDQSVERVLVLKVEPQVDWTIAATSDQVAEALETAPPCVYIRVSDDLSWRTMP